MSVPPVIIYRYAQSPYAQKVDNTLYLKGIPHKQVKISMVLPRPEISGELGINYRRIPILAIGNDVYCDSNLIVSVLERRFPASAGYSTLLPAGKDGRTTHTGLVKEFSKYYVENALFNNATGLISWDKLPAPFLKDRGDLMGRKINPAALAGVAEKSISELSTHLVAIEEQLSDGREWLFDTVTPGLADISVHFVLAWIKGMPTSAGLFDEKRFPNALKWLNRLSALLKSKKNELGTIVALSGEVAGNDITSSSHEPDAVVGFDAQEAQRLKVQFGDVVQVAPEDTGRNYPTVGKLVALSLEEVVLEVQAKDGKIRCHFPRLGYSIRAVREAKL
ncbi:hypothetical protein FA13DRAFT_1734066 [Coprinellus micaceus]|uniref:GST N-terminal domain-containing protein n=1 Tax=Coprinellus micaceus TaxID=71717 RepID=A0A4Y7T7T2_COPMI|nr:hypothetical protein FA13DRAFT_1734066 [Coprinellus micaceus]